MISLFTVTPISQAQTAITSVMTDIGTVLFSGLTAVLALVAALTGLFFAIRLIRKYIGRNR